MANNVDSDKTTLKECFDPNMHYWQRHFRRYQYFRSHEKCIPSDLPAEMVCNIVLFKDGLNTIFHAPPSLKSTKPTDVFKLGVKETGQSAPVIS